MSIPKEDFEKRFWSKFNIAYVSDKGFAFLGTEIVEFIRAEKKMSFKEGQEDMLRKVRDFLDEELKSNSGDLPYYRYIAQMKDDLLTHLTNQ